MALNLTAGGIGLLLAAAVITLIWKSKRQGKRSHGWLALFAGLFASYVVMSWLASFALTTVAGVSIFAFIIVVCGILFWHECVKNKDPHHIRTPVAAFALGVALVATFGGVRTFVGNATTQVTSVVHHEAPSVNVNGG